MIDILIKNNTGEVQSVNLLGLGSRKKNDKNVSIKVSMFDKSYDKADLTTLNYLLAGMLLRIKHIKCNIDLSSFSEECLDVEKKSIFGSSDKYRISFADFIDPRHSFLYRCVEIRNTSIILDVINTELDILYLRPYSTMSIYLCPEKPETLEKYLNSKFKHQYKSKLILLIT